MAHWKAARQNRASFTAPKRVEFLSFETIVLRPEEGALARFGDWVVDSGAQADMPNHQIRRKRQ